MHIVTMIKNGKHGLKDIGTVEVKEGHLDNGYIELFVSNFEHQDTATTATIFITVEEAEAIAMNLNLARKHSAINTRRS